MSNPKELERKANKQLVKLQSEENQLSVLQNELSRNPQFVEFLEAQKKLQKKTDEFWNEVKAQMVDNSITEINIDNDFVKGKLSISYVKSYDTSDITKVDKKFIVKSLDAKKVAAEVKATNELPAGVEEKGYHRLNKSLKPKVIVS